MKANKYQPLLLYPYFGIILDEIAEKRKERRAEFSLTGSNRDNVSVSVWNKAKRQARKPACGKVWIVAQ